MITRRNAVLCLLWVVFVLSLPIYAIWTVFNHEHLYSWTEKFCGFFKKSNNSKTMDEKKTNQIKRQLEMRWYKRHAKNLVGNEDYAYMKTTRNADGEFKHIIVLGSAGSERIDVVLTRPKFSVAECEEIAEKLAEFFKPYFDKYKVRKI